MAFLIMLSIGVSGMLYVFFDVAQLHFKMEAQEEAKVSACLQTIKVPVKEFITRKEQNEIWENSNLYDVRSYVIINDTAFVSVLHDEGEEGLVKSIVDSFGPGDTYSADNIVHVCKHRIYPPEIGKVIVEKYTICFVGPLDIFKSGSQVKEHFCKVATDVIKPPPRRLTVA
jgi:hypothetical protein